MRITFLCPHLGIAGGVRAILTHADRLAERGHDVSVVVPAQSRLRAWWRNRRPGAPDWMPGLRARVVWTAGWDADELPDGDALIATAWQSAEPAAAAPPRCGAKFYFVQHYESLYHGEPERVDATYRLPLRKIAISTWIAGIMAERFGSVAPVIVTPVDTALFHRVPEAVDGSLRVLMLDHGHAWKGAADAALAIAQVRARHSALQAVGFGVRPPVEPGTYDEFFVKPPQGRLAWLYSRCAIYLCPSWDEGLGMPAMEAMACGAALCTYDTGGSREYAFDGETALVAPRRDVDALGHALDRLVQDAALRERIARAGQTFVTTRFHWDVAAARFESVLRGDAGESPGPLGHGKGE